MALSESGEIREPAPGSRSPRPSRRPKNEPTAPHDVSPESPTHVGENPLLKTPGPEETNDELFSQDFGDSTDERNEVTEITRNPFLEVQSPDTTLVPVETEPATEIKPRPPTPESKPKAATLRTLSGGVSTGVSVEFSEPRREPTQYERTVAQAERSSVLAKEKLLQGARKKIEQLMEKNQLKKIIAELDSILKLGATIPSDLLDRLLKIWPEELSPYESGEKRPEARSNPVGPARRGPRIMARPETPPPAPRQPEPEQTPSGTGEPDNDTEGATEEIEDEGIVLREPPAITMPTFGTPRSEGPSADGDDLELEEYEPTSREPSRIFMPRATIIKESLVEPGPVSDWEGPEPSTPPGGTTLSKLKWKERISRLKGFVNGLFSSTSSEKISDAQAPRMTQADVVGFGEAFAQMRQPTAAETTQPPAETRVQPQENNLRIEDEPTEESTQKKPGFLSRLFGRSKKPAPPPAPPTPPTPPSAPKPKGNGFLSNLLDSKLGKWGKRLAIIGLASLWGGRTANEAQDTESKSSGFPTEQKADTDFQQSKTTDFNREIFNLLQKEATLKEKLKIGTVGSDSEHNALVKLVQAQIEHSPQDFGFTGEASDLSHWANELAKDTAKAHGITGLGGEWRLTGAAIGELSVLVDVGEDGRPAISYHNAHDGSLLKNDQLTKFFFQHDAGEPGAQTHDFGRQNIKSTVGEQETVDFSLSDDAKARFFELQRLNQRIASLDNTTSLSDLSAANNQAYKNWLVAENALQYFFQTEDSTTLGSKRETVMDIAKRLDRQDQLMNQANEALTRLNQATKNLELNIQHQEFAQNPLAGLPLRRYYENAFNEWQEAVANQPTDNSISADEQSVPEPINFLEQEINQLANQVEAYGRALDMQISLEQQKKDLSERIYKIRPSKNLEEAHIIYLTLYQNYKLDLNSLVATSRFDVASNQLAEMQAPIEKAGELLNSLLLLEAYDDTLKKRVSQLRNPPKDIKAFLAKYLVASRLTKHSSCKDLNFNDLVNDAVRLGRTLDEDLTILETMEAEEKK